MTSFRNLNQATGRKISLDGIDYLFFGGTAYLGLLVNQEYIQLYKSGIELYGLNNGTSRTNNVQLGIYTEAESVMSSRFGFQAAALFSSGYLAAQAAVKTLAIGKKVIYAPESHPALWLGGSPNVDVEFEQWTIDTIELINNAEEDEFVVISNCIDNLTPQQLDFSSFKKINPSKRITLILDDSHGLGVLKKNAVSTNLDELKLDHLHIVIVASMAKGLGTDAGIVLGEQKIINQIKRNPIFTGASPTAAAGLYALINGEKIYEKAFDNMQFNAQLFKSLTKNIDLNHIENFPVFSSKSPYLYKHLLQKKVLISSFPYPLETSPLLNRIVVSALHTEDDIHNLAEILYSES